MSCLLPHLKCSPDIFFIPFKTHSTQLSKTRETVYCGALCMLTTAPPPTLSSATTVLGVDKLQLSSLEDHFNSVSSNRPWTYLEATRPPAEENFTARFGTETLLNNEENVIAAATEAVSLAKAALKVAKDAAVMENFTACFGTETLLNDEENVIAAATEAVALAKAALKVAKDAALMINNNQSSNFENKPSIIPSEYDTKFKRTQLAQTAQVGVVGDSVETDIGLEKEHSMLNNFHELDDLEPTPEELEFLQVQLSESIAVRSERQTERKARRSRAAEKVASSVVSIKSGYTSGKNRASVQEVDYSDPLRYLRGTTSTSKLLNAKEELELSEGIQVLLKLEKLQNEIVERGGQPTFSQWAAAAGVDQKTLRKQLNYGVLCKDKMIKSNIRLVISIAKHYQGAGMNLQDLVQEGCRGLVRGVEKFDASKGFKFSTYAHWWIKQSIRKSLSDQSRTIRLPFHMVEATYRVKEARKKLYSENGRHPSNEEVAEATGLSMRRLTSVLLAPKPPKSLDQKIGINMNLKPSEIISDPDAESTEDLLIKQFMKQDLDKVLDTLNPREKRVLKCRFGLEDGRMKTLQEIGELMGISRERIRQIESCAFRKLKNKRSTKHLLQYLVA